MMKVSQARKIASEFGMKMYYCQTLRLYVLDARHLNWPDQYFPGQVIRAMDEKTFIEFYIRGEVEEIQPERDELQQKRDAKVMQSISNVLNGVDAKII